MWPFIVRVLFCKRSTCGRFQQYHRYFFHPKKTNRVMLVDVSMFLFLKESPSFGQRTGASGSLFGTHTQSHEAPTRVGDDFHHIPSHLNEELFFIDCAVSGTHHLRSAAYDQWRHGGGVRTPRKENVWDFLKYRSWLQKQFNVLIFSSEANAHASWVDGKSPEHTETRCNFFKYPRKSGQCDLDKVFI